MDDGCQSIPRPWLNAYSHTHSLRGKSERERGTCEKVPVTFTLVFSPHFLGISLLCALPERSLLFVRPIIVVALGLGWAGRLGRLTDGSFFWFSTFFIQATGERGRCVNNNNNNNNVTRVDPSRSLSLVMMVIIIIIITLLVKYYYYYVLSSIQKKKKSRPLRVH